MVKNTYFDPSRFLKNAFPKGFWEKNFATQNKIDLKKYVIRTLRKGDLVSEIDIETTAEKVLKYYKKKFEILPPAEFKQLIEEQSLLRDRMENLAVWSEVQKIKEVATGRFYRWIPSDAEHPDPEHQLLYGKVFAVGEGDANGNMPGERYGCRCGMELLDVEDIEELKK